MNYGPIWGCSSYGWLKIDLAGTRMPNFAEPQMGFKCVSLSVILYSKSLLTATAISMVVFCFLT